MEKNGPLTVCKPSPVRFDDLRAVEDEDRDDDAETLADIKRFRSEQGLPVDDATLAWFLEEYKAERHEGGMWLTEAEADEHFRVESAPERTRGGTRQEAHPFEFSETELEALAERIADDEGLAAEGLTWVGIETDLDANRITVEIAGRDAATAQAIITSRYGPAVTCEWVGPEDTVSEEVAWLLWTVDESDRRLTVHYSTWRAAEFDRAEHSEDEREVTVTVFVRVPHVVKTIGRSFTATVELDAPLGHRRVVDGVTGRARDRRIPREIYERTMELIGDYAANHPDTSGGCWTAAEAGRLACHVAFTTGVDAHREALAKVLPEPSLLVVHDVQRTEAELGRLADRIRADRRELGKHGIGLDGAEVDVEDNEVNVEIQARDEDDAARVMADRYGPGLAIMWVSA
jgi:hypothetical protein